MNEIKLMLIPQPGAKPEFLANIRVVDPSPAVSKVWKELPTSEIILEAYSRDAWAWKPNSTSFSTVTVESTDGRNKLPGFISFLQQRQKASFGRFASKGIWVISYVQTKQSNPNRMECRISLDLTKISGCTVKPRNAPASQSATPKYPPPASSSSTKPKKAGFLGKLVGAQKRTNQDLMVASTPATRVVQKAPPPTASSTTAASATSNGTVPALTAVPPAAAVQIKTYVQVMNEFRQQMEAKMVDFDIAPDDILKVSISLPEYTSTLSDVDKPKLTMEILKYMVYEAAEEVNEEWIAHKEPSEFMDEAVICIYKEGAAPPEVLEEINKGEMPDEVRGQQQAIQQERMRQVNQAEQRKANLLENQAHAWDNGGRVDQEEEEGAPAALNTNKRDRRTIEDFEREKKKVKPS